MQLHRGFRRKSKFFDEIYHPAFMPLRQAIFAKNQIIKGIKKVIDRPVIVHILACDLNPVQQRMSSDGNDRATMTIVQFLHIMQAGIAEPDRPSGSTAQYGRATTAAKCSMFIEIVPTPARGITVVLAVAELRLLIFGKVLGQVSARRADMKRID